MVNGFTNWTTLILLIKVKLKIKLKYLFYKIEAVNMQYVQKYKILKRIKVLESV